jgi:heme exporter protein B
MIKFMLTIVRRDLLMVARQPSEMLNPLVFFVLVIALFPLGISPEAALYLKRLLVLYGWRQC